MFRNLAKNAVALAAYGSGMARFRGLSHPLVLGYHRVVPDPRAVADVASGMAISTSMLERHLDHVSRRFRFVSLDEAAQATFEGRAEALATVTFDDGYRDVYDHALPLLLRKGIPATVFMVTELTALLHDELWYRLRGALGIERADRATPYLLRHWPVARIRRLLTTCAQQAPAPLALPALLSWDQAAELQRHGFGVGSHTTTHPILTQCDDTTALNELRRSHQTLTTKLGTTPRHLAYPDGQFSPRLARLAERTGYSFAYTTCGHRDPHLPLLTMPRLMLWERSSLDALGRFAPAVFACQCAGLWERLAPCRRAHVDERPLV